MGSVGLPFLSGRLRQNFEVTPGIGDPIDALSRIYTDTVLHDPRVLRFVTEIVGADRIMMGSDAPFPIGDLAPTKIVAGSGVNATTAARINGGLAADLFRLT
jgi:aminocarboxymuconate-semialdehyde decarboxylase